MRAPPAAVIIDTGNYHPPRDGVIDALVEGRMVEGLWVQEQYGRPIKKAWNTITDVSFAKKTSKPGATGRIALPVAGDNDDARGLVMDLVEITGCEAFDAGVLAESWRQQPGTPVYMADLTTEELSAALAKADASRSWRRRDLLWAVWSERMEAGEDTPERLLALARAIF